MSAADCILYLFDKIAREDAEIARAGLVGERDEHGQLTGLRRSFVLPPRTYRFTGDRHAEAPSQ